MRVFGNVLERSCDNHCGQVWLSQGHVGTSMSVHRQAGPYVRSGQSREGRSPGRQRWLCSGSWWQGEFLEDRQRSLVSKPQGSWHLMFP